MCATDDLVAPQKDIHTPTDETAVQVGIKCLSIFYACFFEVQDNRIYDEKGLFMEKNVITNVQDKWLSYANTLSAKLSIGYARKEIEQATQDFPWSVEKYQETFRKALLSFIIQMGSTPKVDNLVHAIEEGLITWHYELGISVKEMSSWGGVARYLGLGDQAPGPAPPGLGSQLVADGEGVGSNVNDSPTRDAPDAMDLDADGEPMQMDAEAASSKILKKKKKKQAKSATLTSTPFTAMAAEIGVDIGAMSDGDAEQGGGSSTAAASSSSASATAAAPAAAQGIFKRVAAKKI